ncbi:uracil-xanthine permease family protein [Calorimonas adulescens]|uniref:Uracil-xanthine permease n=1 Tax=Calorimonas adulescens TaxID=2606906 RepID=A0A5D8QFV3_9THEO|nr:uracil-xanthine permease family protein [Calorimonas adulescens]TZE83425.1 uracil-xanthine permease [Calorimonas adulescens]
MENIIKATKAKESVEEISGVKLLIVGIQHLFTMFGATVLVPLTTGMNVSVALFTAGVGTLLFHLITRFEVPIFLGSSFAYIAPIILVSKNMGGLQYAQGGIIVAGLLYVVFAALVKIIGAEKIKKLLPPIVTGPIIMVIGLNLAPTAVNMASENWLLAGIAFATVVVVNMYAKGFFKVIPVLFGLAAGYIASAILGYVDYTPIIEAKWFAMPAFTFPKFSWDAIAVIAPVALVTAIEHIGDVLSVSETVGKDFIKRPGLSVTLLGDGLATALAALLGGPANTTYSENTGVLALTKIYNPVVMEIAAISAICISVIGKFGAVISTIPQPVIGGISIVLFGMISSIGIKTIVNNNLDFGKTRNLLIAATILVLGIGGAVFDLGGNIKLAGMSLGAIAGIILNLILPEE